MRLFDNTNTTTTTTNKSLQEGESYKYLRILEADKFLEEKMKLDVSKEYIRRLRKVSKSKLNQNSMVGI